MNPLLLELSATVNVCAFADDLIIMVEGETCLCTKPVHLCCVPVVSEGRHVSVFAHV